jgi:hypothetical protein
MIFPFNSNLVILSYSIKGAFNIEVATLCFASSWLIKSLESDEEDFMLSPFIYFNREFL